MFTRQSDNEFVLIETVKIGICLFMNVALCTMLN